MCERCRALLELEAETALTSLACPRCARLLERTTELVAGPLACATCGGLFVAREVLAELLCLAEANAQSFGVRPTRSSSLEPVRYLACPVCRGSMNRVNFGRTSGIIVDVCREDGTWFDPTELSAALAFAAAGGLSRARLREAEERAATARAERAGSSIVFAPYASSYEARLDRDRLAFWRELVRVLLG